MWVKWAGCEGVWGNSTTSRSKKKKKSRTHFVPERQEGPACSLPANKCLLSPLVSRLPQAWDACNAKGGPDRQSRIPGALAPPGESQPARLSAQNETQMSPSPQKKKKNP